MKIVFTKHANGRFDKFREDGIVIPKNKVKNTIESPDNVDKKSDKPKIIASKRFNSQLVLRVVYKVEGDIIIIVTFYLAKKGRYYESN